MNPEFKMYGGEKLQTLLSFGSNDPAPSADNGVAETVCNIVLDDVAEFSAGTEQSDDITMLCIRYIGRD